MSPSGIIFWLLLHFGHTSKFKTSQRLLDEEIIIIERVKLLFHLFLNPPSVIK